MIARQVFKYVTPIYIKKANSSPDPMRLHFGAKMIQLHIRLFT